MEEEDKECANTSQFRENWAKGLRSEPGGSLRKHLGTSSLYIPLPGCQDISKGEQNKTSPNEQKAKLSGLEIFQGSRLKN